MCLGRLGGVEYALGWDAGFLGKDGMFVGRGEGGLGLGPECEGTKVEVVGQCVCDRREEYSVLMYL